MKKDYIKNQFVTYEIALKLKELGFNEECWFQYSEGNLDYCYKYEKKPTNIPTIKTACLAPLWQQVIDFFREKYDLNISILPYYRDGRNLSNFRFEIYINGKNKFDSENYLQDYSLRNYKLSRKVAILKAIELIKK